MSVSKTASQKGRTRKTPNGKAGYSKVKCRKTPVARGSNKKQGRLRMRKRHLASKTTNSKPIKSGLISDSTVVQLILTNDLRDDGKTDFFKPEPLKFNPDANLITGKDGKVIKNGELKRSPEAVAASAKAAKSHKTKVVQVRTPDQLLNHSMKMANRTLAQSWVSPSDIILGVRRKAREACLMQSQINEAYKINGIINNLAEQMTKGNLDRLVFRAIAHGKVVQGSKIVNRTTNSKDRGDLLLLWNAKQSEALDKREQRRDSAASFKAALGAAVVKSRDGHSLREIPVHEITEAMKGETPARAKAMANAMLDKRRQTTLAEQASHTSKQVLRAEKKVELVQIRALEKLIEIEAKAERVAVATKNSRDAQVRKDKLFEQQCAEEEFRKEFVELHQEAKVMHRAWKKLNKEK